MTWHDWQSLCDDDATNTVDLREAIRYVWTVEDTIEWMMREYRPLLERLAE